MEIDKEGNLWEASLYTGIYKHTLDSGGVVSSKLYSTKNGLSSNDVSKISCGDDDGRMWFYTQNGVCLLLQDASGNEHFDYLGEKDGIKGQSIYSIEHEGNIFTLTDEALFITQNKLSSDSKKVMPKVAITGLSVNGVEVTFTARNKHIEVVINDNGCGFDPKSPTSRNGLTNMKRKAQQIDHDLIILS